MKLTTLETRRLRADLVEVYKIINGLEEIGEETFFERRQVITRGHTCKIFFKKGNHKEEQVIRCRLDVAKYSFANRTCNERNNDNDKRESSFRCQTTMSEAPHDKSHEEEVWGRSRVEIREDRPRRESRLWRKKKFFRLERKESR